MAKTPLFTVFRAFHVFLKLQKQCKYQHFLRSTCQKCCNLQCFLLCLQKHWYLQCFMHLESKKYWYLQHFLRFCMAPATEVKTQKCCNLQHLVTFEKLKIVRKRCPNGAFSDFRYPQNRGGGMLLETLMSDPDSVQKAFPHPPEGFLVFFGAQRRRVGGLGRPYLRALVALGRS